jgi:type IX secretion system PorP/SprF family membrane protein
LYNDKNGNTIQKGAKVSFAHHLVLNYPTKQYLSLGLSYNMNTFRIDIANFNPTFDTPIIDPSVTDDRSITNHNFDVSALYRYGRFYASFNASNILAKKTDEFTGIEPNQLLNYQVYSGYIIKSKKYKKVEFEPSVYYQLFGSDLRSSTDVNFKFRKYDRDGDYYWAGASYRFLNDQFLRPLNVGPMAGIMKNKFYFAYSYQITMNDLSSFNSGTHSVTVGLNILQGASDCPCTKTRADRNN